MKKLTEHDIQALCVEWFGRRYPDVKMLLFAVPNGGARFAWQAKRLKDEGVRAGVADLILQIPRKGYATLAIEMKTPEGRQMETQKEYERICTAYKNKYIICRSVDEFKRAIIDYLEG